MENEYCVICTNPRPKKYDVIQLSEVESLPKNWECPNCFLNNNFNENKCTICKEPRP